MRSEKNETGGMTHDGLRHDLLHLGRHLDPSATAARADVGRCRRARAHRQAERRCDREVLCRLWDTWRTLHPCCPWPVLSSGGSRVVR